MSGFAWQTTNRVDGNDEIGANTVITNPWIFAS